jgi:pimeloyl-ACP methyl ester carboxylesterase
LFAIAPRGTHSSAWTQKSPPNYVERSHLLLGYTVDEGRVVDVLSAVRRFSRVSKEPIPVTIVAKGEGGILAAYAALFEPSIKEVVVIDPPKSHKEGPHFLNVMRVLDIPEALGLLAPTPLTIIGGDAKAFERTAEIYRLAGAAEKLTRK